MKENSLNNSTRIVIPVVAKATLNLDHECMQWANIEDRKCYHHIPYILITYIIMYYNILIIYIKNVFIFDH